MELNSALVFLNDWPLLAWCCVFSGAVHGLWLALGAARAFAWCVRHLP